MNKHMQKKQMTRKKIFESTTVLITEIGYKAITVTKVVSHAKISRGTFYQHFMDIIDVFDQMEEYILENLKMLQVKFQRHIQELTDFTQTNENLRDEKGLRKTLEEIYIFIYSNRIICSAIITNQLGFNFIETFIPKIMKSINLDSLKKSSKYNFPIEYFISHRIYSHVGFIMTWFERGYVESPKELSNIYLKILLSRPL